MPTSQPPSILVVGWFLILLGACSATANTVGLSVAKGRVLPANAGQRQLLVERFQQLAKYAEGLEMVLLEPENLLSVLRTYLKWGMVKALLFLLAGIGLLSRKKWGGKLFQFLAATWLALAIIEIYCLATRGVPLSLLCIHRVHILLVVAFGYWWFSRPAIKAHF